MVMDRLQESRNGSSQQPQSNFSRLIEFLKETLRNCREIYSIRQDDVSLVASSVVFEPVVLLPLSTVLGSDDVTCSFILFLSNQLDSKYVWETYGIERSGRVKGVDTTYLVRLEEFVEFEESEFLRDKFSTFNETQNRRAPSTNTDFAQKLSKHLNSMHVAGLRTHVIESYAEIDMLKDKLLETENDKQLLKDLLIEANKKLISKTRQGLVYNSSKRDITSATPSAACRNEKRQLDKTITSATKDVQKYSPNASAESYAYILSAMAAELLPDQQAVLKENCILIQIARNVIPVWRVLHAWVSQHKSDETIRKLHQILLMFVVGTHAEHYAECTKMDVLHVLQIHDPKGRLHNIASKKK